MIYRLTYVAVDKMDAYIEAKSEAEAKEIFDSDRCDYFEQGRGLFRQPLAIKKTQLKNKPTLFSNPAPSSLPLLVGKSESWMAKFFSY